MAPPSLAVDLHSGSRRRCSTRSNVRFGKAQRPGGEKLAVARTRKWRSKGDTSLFDIEIGGERLQWNGAAKDWVSSATSINEVGPIHTIQGYDLNYTGVIIGPDLRYDRAAGKLYFVRDSYFDIKGKQTNSMLGINYSDDDLLTYVTNIYRVF